MADNCPLIQPTDRGLYCEAGDFFIDPWRPVDRAVVSHAHSDHARYGCKSYLTSREGAGVLEARIGNASPIEGVEYGETRLLNGVKVSLHPAGHILGSSQVRVEHRGEVWVFSGDYKTVPDRTCTPFEPVPCHAFITESTFGLPIYRWQPQQTVFDSINAWWRQNQERGRASVIFVYSLGKAQRVLGGIDAGIGPILVHGAVHNMLAPYEQAGIVLPPVEKASLENAKGARGRGLVIAPPSAAGTPWMKKFGPASLAFASGWMAVRGARRWRALDRGFVLSDHADWPGLMEAIEATGASRVGVTHGFIDPMVRFLNETGGVEAYGIATRYNSEPVAGEADDTGDTEAGVAEGEEGD